MLLGLLSLSKLIVIHCNLLVSPSTSAKATADGSAQLRVTHGNTIVNKVNKWLIN